MSERVELRTIPEAIDRLRTSRRTFYRLVKQGRIRLVHQGARSYVTTRELDAYLASLVRAA